MKKQALGIAGCFLFEHNVFSDDRGHFREWFKQSDLDRIDSGFDVAQANLSSSKKGVIRGMHYSLAPQGQSKLVACAVGKVRDVLIDIRIDSPTFMKQEKIMLSGEEGVCVLIPSGIAHGFLGLASDSTVVYLLSSEYDAESEKSIHPFDTTFDIDWGRRESKEFIISERDRSAPSFIEVKNCEKLPKIAKS